MKTFMDIYVKTKRKEMQKLWNHDCLNISAKELIEELLEMLEKTGKEMRELRDRR